MRIAILGFGREGRSLFRYLSKRGLTRNWNAPAYRQAGTNADEIWIIDRNADAKLRINTNDAKKVNWQLGKNCLKNLSRFDIIFRSPGIPYTLYEIQKAKKAGAEISSATKLFFNLLQSSPSTNSGNKKSGLKIIGVTGTKGKGTVSTLIYKILKASGFKTILAGNIGKPMLDCLPQTKKADFVVLELSSFQLQDLKESPQVAVVLDIFPDHLDAHKNLGEYHSAKANIGRFQKKSEAIFYFSANPLSKKIASQSPAKKFGIRPPGDNLTKNWFMAAAVCRYLGAPEKIIEKTIKTFQGLEHRLELVRRIRVNQRTHPRKSASIEFYNDSGATNPHSGAAAIRSFKNPVILIAGGKDKRLDYRPLAQTIKKSGFVKAVILFGENKNKIKKVLVTSNKKQVIRVVKDLKTAVKLAYQTAKKLINPDARSESRLPDKGIPMKRRDSSTRQLITILFSPASASFDMFKDYKDRGKQFKKIVRAF